MVCCINGQATPGQKPGETASALQTAFLMRPATAAAPSQTKIVQTGANPQERYSANKPKAWKRWGSGNSPGDAEVEPPLPDRCPASVLVPAAVTYAAKPPAANCFL